MKHQLSSFLFDVPENWCDITPEDDPTHPFTMALDGGIGVIQVSLAEWAGGVQPEINSDALATMFVKYCEAQGLAIEATVFDNGNVAGVGGRHSAADELFAAWYVSNGVSVALVTYVSQFPGDPASEAEFAVACRLVSSSRFRAEPPCE